MNEEMPYHTSLFVSYPISPGFVVQDDNFFSFAKHSFHN